MASPPYTAHAGRRPAYPGGTKDPDGAPLPHAGRRLAYPRGSGRHPKPQMACCFHMRAGGPRTQVTTGGSRSPRRHAASTCVSEARVPRWQRAAAEDPDGVSLQPADRRPAYPGGSRRQPKPQIACRFNLWAGGPRTPGAAGGSRSPRWRAASTCGPAARVPRWQRGLSVADACSSSLSRHPRTDRMYPKAKTSRAGLATLTIRTGLW